MCGPENLKGRCRRGSLISTQATATGAVMTTQTTNELLRCVPGVIGNLGTTENSEAGVRNEESNTNLGPKKGLNRISIGGVNLPIILSDYLPSLQL